MDRFKYTDRLRGDEIRILTLKPADDPKSDIECLLTTYSRDECGPYEALSYCWGAPSPTVSIKVNGLSLEIRDGLASALYHIRSADQPRYLWADAICINQASDAEKSVQVARMNETYSKCRRALAWLGRSSDEEQSHLAMKSIESICSQFEGRSLIEVRHSQLPLPPTLFGAGINTYLLAIQRLLERAWFTRLWIVQEVCLAPQVDIMCGSDIFPFKHITNLQLAFLFSPDMQVPPADAPSHISYWKSPRYAVTRLFDRYLTLTRQVFQVTAEEAPKIEEIRQRSCTLLSHIWNFRKRNCENPRDRVYALLNLTKDVNELIFPDYSESISTTYARAASAIMTKHHNLDVLFLCNGPEKSIAREAVCPSWVPNFDFGADLEWNLWTLDPLTVYLPGAAPYFTATSASTADPSFSKDLHELTLSGYHLGTIDACTTLDRPSDIWFAWILVAKRNEVVSPREVFWRTMITDRRADGSPADAEKEGKEFEQWWDDTIKSDHIDLNRVESYDKAWYLHGYRRRLFTTNRGLVGLARPTIQIGDHVCLLAGAQTPYTLRKKSDKYQIVCETYVRDSEIMTGKYWEDLKDARAERAAFVII